MLFDIGIAGPIAGFLVAVPALFLGMWMSRVVVFPSGTSTASSWASRCSSRRRRGSFGDRFADGYTVNLHPVAFGAWFGLLATALNLFPIGQFDGGHISYAVLGRKSSQVTLVMIGCAAVLTYFSMSWLVWTVLAIVMLFVFGRHHPRTFDEDVPLDRRTAVARALRGRHVHPLLHAGTDRTAEALTVNEFDAELAETRRIVRSSASSAISALIVVILQLNS